MQGHEPRHDGRKLGGVVAAAPELGTMRKCGASATEWARLG